MATSTLIQKLDSGTEFGAATSNRSQTETYLAASAITAGDWVQFDSGKTGADRTLYVEQCANTALGGVAIGVALDSATAADQSVRVVVAGYVASANVLTGVAADAPLSVDTTAGQADAADAANAVICGVCLDTAAGNVAPVYVYKRV
jgi:hypothetical protein